MNTTRFLVVLFILQCSLFFADATGTIRGIQSSEDTYGDDSISGNRALSEGSRVEAWTRRFSEEGRGRRTCGLDEFSPILGPATDGRTDLPFRRNTAYFYALVSGFRCWGSYCDDVALGCTLPDRIVAGTFSTYTRGFFSEEQGAMICDPNDFMLSMECDNDYCDSIKITCTNIEHRRSRGCKWTDYYLSEEGRYNADSFDLISGSSPRSNGDPAEVIFEEGFYVAGIECDGDFCDHKRFWICEEVLRFDL